MNESKDDKPKQSLQNDAANDDKELATKRLIGEFDARKPTIEKQLKVNKNTVTIIVGLIVFSFFGLIIYSSKIRPNIYHKFNSRNRVDIANIGISIVPPTGFFANSKKDHGVFFRNDGAKILARKRQITTINPPNSTYRNRFSCVFYADKILQEFKQSPKDEIIYSNPALLDTQQGGIAIIKTANQRITAFATVSGRRINELIAIIPKGKADLTQKQYTQLFGSLKSIPIHRKIKAKIKNKSNKNKLLNNDESPANKH